jgi:soluble lytic murein transglycosylase
MRYFLVATTPVRWFSVCLLLWISIGPATPFAVNASRSTKKTTHRKTEPEAPKAKAAGAAALLALAQRQLDQNNLQVASDYASRAAKEAPDLDDYANYIRAEAQTRLHNPAEVTKAVPHVFDKTPPSPLAGPAAALAVRADLDSDNPQNALDLVRKYYMKIPEPQADFLMARSFQATGDLAQAAEYFQRVYYGYPKTQEAGDAETALDDIRTKLGENYPPPMPTAMLGRAMKLMQARDYVGARNELNNVIPKLGGAQRDLAMIRLGEIDFFRGDYAAAVRYLDTLSPNDPDADAERLDYLARSALKLNKQADLSSYLAILERKYPQSPWRLDLLLTAGNQALFENDAPSFMRVFSACAESFPGDQGAFWCDWRVAFEHYKQRAPEASPGLRAFVTTFPVSVQANSALYFLGRIAEQHTDPRSARAYYDAIVDHYPNTYYALQARERLKSATIREAEPDETVLDYLKTVQWPPKPRGPSFEPDRIAQKRLTRARLLHLALLDDWAELELRYGAKNDGGQPYVYAYELAKIANDRGAPDQAIRYIKAYSPSYLLLDDDAVPSSFWHLAFPLPYRASLERYSRAQRLDPYLVAALIRQESEFNPKAISRANAYGLMQVLPSTGRQLARQLKIRRFSAHDLLTSDRNLQLGTMYFRSLLDSSDGSVVEALAAFNAGRSRVVRWNSWGPYTEQAEFVESIPFTETRDYVQVVMRNADIYRRLYGSAVVDGVSRPEAPAASKPAAAKSKAPSAKKPVSKNPTKSER